jgi:hypothetical protein
MIYPNSPKIIFKNKRVGKKPTRHILRVYIERLKKI